MRLRNIPEAYPAVEKSPYCIKDANLIKGSWKELDWVKGKKALHIEIGMGKGNFIIGMAGAHPDIAYLGIERYESVLYKALLKLGDDFPDNLRFLREDAGLLTEFFDHEEVERIYLNFSDPWPKERHAKRRLTHHGFLDKYHSVLPMGGCVEFKTDNEGLFDFSLEEIKETKGWELLTVTRDLHNDPALCEGNIMTEYEEKFSSLGHPIYKLIAKTC
ncbi:MAG: tRNA (guanosine(46)-N7)-methyltransferase TrmB [Lachnospiraceae bacterium]|nr:tRNA (guanosine(46)-N7)-methyltransferase TrmB [Lachnospiraceae bacterium]